MQDVTCSVIHYIHYMSRIYYMLSLVAVAAAGQQLSLRRPTSETSARAVSSPFSVGFILPDIIPGHGDLCEVLATYR